MERRSIYPYFFLGTAFRYLQDAREGWPVKEAGVIFNIDRLVASVDELNLRVTRGLHPVRVLEELRTKLAGEDSDELTSDEADELRTIMHNIRPTIDSELETLSAFIVSDKRWNVDKLLNGAGQLFRPGVFAALPDEAKTDFEEGRRCIAFERPTASAFHLLRGTESALRACYVHFVRQKRLAGDKRMWGPMVEEMRKHRRRPGRRF